MKIFSRTNLILAFILLLAATFRLQNINWDNGHQLHPDERAIVMTVEKLKFPDTLAEFLSPESSWNPHFFAYGSFPMYLLRVTGNAVSILDPALGQYMSINLVGRVLSALADLLSVILIYKIARKLFNSQIGLLSAFFYTISVLPIQLSHFFAVDTFLTSFMLATLYFLILFYEKPRVKWAILVGLFFGLSLSTKISAVVLAAPIGLTLTIDFLLIFLKNPHKYKHWLPHLPKYIKHLSKHALIICATSFTTFILLEPYAVIDFTNFWAQTTQQSALTIDPFYFPYTLQYVGKTLYLYEFKNVFLWGLGSILGALSVAGAFYFIFLFVKKERDALFAKEAIVLMFFIPYILVVGKFAVGFMRYMLPVYPFFAFFAAVLAYKFIQLLNRRVKNKFILYILYLVIYTSLLVWPLSFIHIYTEANTRVSASNWIYSNIPADKTLAVEHWDDQLPIGGQFSYNTQILKLYDSDTPEKWAEIDAQLALTDYIVIASNRLYDPLQELIDCQSLPVFRCYPQTAEYYRKLFSGEMGFGKVAEFTNYPTIPIFDIPINDQEADESFTVYDHPKVIIFQKTAQRSTM